MRLWLALLLLGCTAPPTLDPTRPVTVEIFAMHYEPKHLTIRRGQIVRWVNRDAVTHTVTSGTGTTPSYQPLDSGLMAQGDVYRFTFDRPGRYEYLCLPHVDQASMREATVTVHD